MNPYPISVIQIAAIIGSIGFIAFLILLIRKKRLKEEYTLLWLIIAVFFFGLSVFRGSIDTLSGILGISYQPSALFIILIGFLFLLLLHFTVVISDLKTKINTLVTTLTLLEEKLSRQEKER